MFVGPFFVKALHGRNAVEVILTEGYDLKHPTFPILDEKLTRVHGQDCRLYLTRFKNKSPDEDQWLPKESIKNADVLLRKFRAKRRNPDTRIRAILFCGGECQPPASPEGAELRHDTATGPDTTTGYRTESPGPAGTQTQPPPRSSARVSRRALNPLAY
ncbi:hypothetical protein Pst134EB_012315 [Puccinia striiformis f. sp. tritici]|nr:hypothetical protein Pst134EB_012315 [Puccinia striiformis f. sp. tritici]